MSETKPLGGRKAAYDEALKRLVEFNGGDNKFILALDRGDHTECIVSASVGFVMNVVVEFLSTAIENTPDDERVIVLASVLRALELPANKLAAATTIALGDNDTAINTLQAIVAAIAEKEAGAVSN